MMRPDAKVEKVYLYPKPVDFRKSIDGLAALVELDIKVAVFDPVLFVFLDRHRNRVKIGLRDSICQGRNSSLTLTYPWTHITAGQPPFGMQPIESHNSEVVRQRGYASGAQKQRIEYAAIGGYGNGRAKKIRIFVGWS
ncbi:ISPsy5, transposase [Pseudomonas sp. StFLB209]|uniref:IS66 family insertion sequence element accessory protein TnpB n=1 Tax=Pseudomonas sp. StFLB209 TaxID=1028989 RepID=UPI0004F6AED9|nr:IS66 family insertion sequence element accessory protein TnpB [Pseudomonas sp. StFLB209]BAP42068.1 ISPsy5, transposase [Pseudomonas sp. StFLB209]